MAVSDDDRSVELSDEDYSVLPDQTSDDTDLGWGESSDTTTSSSHSITSPPPSRVAKRPRLSPRDIELLDERPPHWS